MRNKSEKRGITLISLIVTIIILLILAGISISMLAGDNSILQRAVEARENNIIGQEKEQITMAHSAAKIATLGNSITDENMQEELNSIVGKNLTDAWYQDEETINIKFTETDHYYQVSEGKVEKVDKMNIAPRGMVCRIDTTYYPTIQEAFDTVTAGGEETTVVLLKNTTENATIDANKKIKFDMNNKKVASKNTEPILAVNGSLDLTKGILATDKDKAIIVNNGGILSLSETNIMLEDFIPIRIEAGGKATIEKGNIIESNTYGIESYGDLTINESNIASTGDNAIITWENSTTTMNGGNLYTAVIGYPVVANVRRNFYYE